MTINDKEGKDKEEPEISEDEVELVGVGTTEEDQKTTEKSINMDWQELGQESEKEDRGLESNSEEKIPVYPNPHLTPPTLPSAPAPASTPTPAAENISTNDSNRIEGDYEIPPMCYCPLTQKIMVDPVVNREGDSFERSAVMQRDGATDTDPTSSSVYYPNRALKAYIEREVERANQEGTVLGKIRSGWDTLVAHSPATLAEHRPVPESFYCPVTLQLIIDPVIDPEGFTYERAAIAAWIRKNHDSPVTRKDLLMSDLYDNNAVLNILLHEAEKPDETIHPSLTQWKEELQSPPEVISIEEEQQHVRVNRQNQDDDGRNSNPYGIPSSGLVMVIPPGHRDYPMTHEDIERRRRQLQAGRCLCMVYLVVVGVVMAFAFLYLPFYWVLLSFAVIGCIYAKRNATLRSEMHS